jgi:diguanylate cyclase (GGDEF)-like protein
MILYGPLAGLSIYLPIFFAIFLQKPRKNAVFPVDSVKKASFALKSSGFLLYAHLYAGHALRFFDIASCYNQRDENGNMWKFEKGRERSSADMTKARAVCAGRGAARGAFVFAAYATGRVLSRRARAGDERRIEQLRRECGTDMLTGLLNRRGGQEKAETMLAMCRRCEKPMAVLMADIDHFKEYNDAHGHLAGDGALCRVDGALQSVLARSSDMVCRFGGEEFLLCTPCRDTAEAMRQAARLRRAVEELGPCAPDGCCAGPLTVSVGVTVYSPARDGSAPVLQDLVSRADRALYIAKKNGRNCVVLL